MGGGEGYVERRTRFLIFLQHMFLTYGDVCNRGTLQAAAAVSKERAYQQVVPYECYAWRGKVGDGGWIGMRREARAGTVGIACRIF